mmetsp:Transcript_440/g.464  ORF Transcript_440/g.464 Transcript_440/m.464 type:complete len:93 (+) Transcript_440:175-453(+)
MTLQYRYAVPVCHEVPDQYTSKDDEIALALHLNSRQMQLRSPSPTSLYLICTSHYCPVCGHLSIIKYGCSERVYLSVQLAQRPPNHDEPIKL